MQLKIETNEAISYVLYFILLTVTILREFRR